MAVFVPVVLAIGEEAVTIDKSEQILEEAKTAVVELYRAALENAEIVDYEKAFEEVRRLYEEARGKGEDLSGSFFQWMREDIAQYNTWEYEVITVALGDDAIVAEGMNALGEERWECVGAYPHKNRLTLLFKRRPRSYLREIPVKEMMTLFGLGVAGE